MTSSVTLCLVQLMDAVDVSDADAAVRLGNFVASSKLSQYILKTAEIRVGPCAPHLFPSNLAACKGTKYLLIW